MSRRKQPDRHQIIDELVERYRRVLEQRLPREPQSLDEVEQTVEEISVEMEREVERRLLEHQQPPVSNREVCPRCQAPARFRCTYWRQVLTRHGQQSIACPYYHCGTCRYGFSPTDRRLGLDGSGLSPQVRAWAARLAVHLPFAEASDTLRDLCAVTVSPSTVERVAVRVGKALRAMALPPPSPAVPHRLYVSVDGTQTPLRDPWKRDGSLGKLVCRWGECKVAVVYAAKVSKRGRAGAAGDPDAVWDAGVAHRAFTGTMEGIDGFRPRVAELLERCRVEEARELVWLGDGAHWVWNLGTALLPRAVQILDYWHLTEHLYTLARARFGGHEAATKEWVHTCQGWLDRDDVEAVLRSLRNWEPQSEAAREVRDREYEFIARNAERMRYGTFRAQGYHVGSGVMEASCRQVVAQRLHEAGMHWREETADALVSLRSAWLSTQRPNLRRINAAAVA
jgi:hypothetical protein